MLAVVLVIVRLADGTPLTLPEIGYESVPACIAAAEQAEANLLAEHPGAAVSVSCESRER